MAEQEKEKTPLGILILGGLNCFLFGFLFLVSSAVSYFKITPQEFNNILQSLESSGISAAVTYQQFKSCSIVPIIISLLFFLSGAGVLLKKERARKLTVYFAFAGAVFILLTVLIQPAMIGLIIFHAVYLGVLIIYFTNKSVEGYFKKEIQ